MPGALNHGYRREVRSPIRRSLPAGPDQLESAQAAHLEDRSARSGAGQMAHGGARGPLITGIDARFDPQFAGAFLLVQTNWKAPANRILKIDLRDPGQDKWRTVVPAGDDAIESFAVIGGKLFFNRLHNVTSRIGVYSLDGAPLGEVALPGPGSGGIYGRADRDEGLLSFSAYTMPYSLYRYSASTGARTLWYRDAVPFEPERFETEQVWY